MSERPNNTSSKSRKGEKRLYDRHHVLFRRKLWNAEEETNKLRGNSSLIVKMHKDIHKNLHNDIELIDGVPCISREMARRVLQNYSPQKDDPIKSIDQLLLSIDKETKNKSKYSRSWLEVGKAACYTIEIQRPYIEIGHKSNIEYII